MLSHEEIDALVAEITGHVDEKPAQERREAVLCEDGEMVQATIDQASAYCRPRYEPSRRKVRMLSLLGEEW